MVIQRYWKQCVAQVTVWWRNNFKASSVWRLTRLYTGLLLVIVGILLWVLYELSVGQMIRNQHHQIQALMQQQNSLANSLTRDDFLSQFKIQADSSRQYILSIETNKATYGELNYIPKKMSRCPQFTRFPIWLDRYDELRLISGCIEETSQGKVMIGMDDEDLYQLKQRFIVSSFIAFVVAITLGIGTGFLFSRQLLKRIHSFNDIAKKVEMGELTARVPISHRQDEYDVMAININRMLTQLEDSFDGIANVTNAIAHDLRTPMGHLRQKIEQALDDAEKNSQDTNSLHEMLTKLDEILYTFTAMLELTRIEHDSQTKAFDTVNLNTIIEDAIALIQPVLEENQQQLQLDIAKPCSIAGDTTLLFRAIYNLLENASKYSGDAALIEVATIENGVIISDNGMGIDETERDRVFQRLYRIEKSRHVPGFGLGLPLVKAIIRMHGGKIELKDNEPGLKVVITFNRN